MLCRRLQKCAHQSHILDVRVLVVVANHLELSDLSAAGPNVRALMSHSGLALVNTGLRKSAAPKYLALGAGAPARTAGSYADRFHDWDEERTVKWTLPVPLRCACRRYLRVRDGKAGAGLRSESRLSQVDSGQ